MHRWTGLSPPVEYFDWPSLGGTSFVDHLCYFCLVLLCFHARLCVDALWSSARKGLTSWLSFVMSNCDVVTFPLVSWVRYGAWLYRFLIFALFLTFKMSYGGSSQRHASGANQRIKALSQGRHWVWGLTHRRVNEEETIAINRHSVYN